MNARSHIRKRRPTTHVVGLSCGPLIAALALSLAPVSQADEPDRPAVETKTGVRANSSSVATMVESPFQSERPVSSKIVSEQSGDSSAVLSRGTSPKIERGKSRTTNSNSTRSGGSFDMLWPLGAVLIIVGCCAWSAKRWMPKSLRSTINAGGAMNILARQTLSTKQSICLVRVGRRLVLMGVSPDRMTTLSEITDAEEVASIVAASESGRAGSFTSLFAKAADEDMKSAELENEMEDSAPAQSDSLVPLGDLAHSRARVQKLLERVRGLANGISTSAEPAKRTMSAQ